jgi:hypothetical protein
MKTGMLVRVHDRMDVGRVTAVLGEGVVMVEFGEGKELYQRWEIIDAYKADVGRGMRLALPRARDAAEAELE